MNEGNEHIVLSQIRADAVVLDIGGWARPFNRANYVLDAEPYETRGYYGAARPAQGGAVEHFSKDRWIQRDICDKEPFPFADDEIDYVICSQTLEDIRDPLFVCSEMSRIAKRGYLEVPRRESESSRGHEENIVGLSHHRWLIDIDGDEVVFTQKYHMIHAARHLSLPASYRRKHVDHQPDQWLFWEGSFAAREVTIHGLANIEAELARYVRERYAYPHVLATAEDLRTRGRRLVRRVSGKLRRELARAR
jgi:SAM-dependent methyltransferase